MVTSHPDVAVCLFTFSVQYISRRKNCTSAVEVLLFPCTRISKEMFYLQKLHHLTDTTVKRSRLTFPDPPIQRYLSVSSSTHFPLMYPSSWLWFPLFNLVLSFWFSFTLLLLLLPTCLLLSHPFVGSSGLTPSNLTTNEQSGCAHRQRISNPHGNPFTLYHKHSPN